MVSAPYFDVDTRHFLKIDGAKKVSVGKWKMCPLLWAASRHMESRRLELGLIGLVNDELTPEHRSSNYTDDEKALWAERMMAVVAHYIAYFHDQEI